MFSNKSKAFQRGFVSGLRSPYTVLYFGRRRYGFKPTDFVALSWKKVGESLQTAMNHEGYTDEQRTHAALKRH